MRSLFVGHFQKEQERDLLGASHVGNPIIAQDMRIVPSFVDNHFGVRHVVSVSTAKCPSVLFFDQQSNRD